MLLNLANHCRTYSCWAYAGKSYALVITTAFMLYTFQCISTSRYDLHGETWDDIELKGSVDEKWQLGKH